MSQQGISQGSPKDSKDRLTRLKTIHSYSKKKPASRLVQQVKKIPKHRKPEDMTLEEWQIAIRREFSREQAFSFKNIGKDPVFSEFRVNNPQTGGSYEVHIRGELPGDNRCLCPDFSINTLGTCKHIEFTLDRLRRRPKTRKELAKGFHPETSELFLRYGEKREVAFVPSRTFPSSLKPLVSKFFDEKSILLPRALPRLGEFLEQMRAKGEEVRCFDDVYGLVAAISDQDSLRARVHQAFPRGIESPELHKLLKTELYPYQKEGTLFAASAGRCLLADDMGLGKTIQAIAASEVLASLGFVERVLIVTPTSLKHQWMQEIGKFSKRTSQIIEGSLNLRASKYETESFYKITNYDVIHRDRAPIGRWAPDLIILDEAQRIKNWQTRTAQSVKKLVSPYAIVLTGTPLENRLEELHSILEFVDRFRLGPLFRFLASHQITDGHGKVTGYQNLSSIKETLKPVLLRRKKEEVLKDLPERLEKRFFLPMTEEQANYHEENREIVAKIVAKWKRTHFLSEFDQRMLRIALQRMRMSCNSTYLLDRNTDFGMKADELMSLLPELFEDAQTKVVLFSQWIGTHEIIMKRLDAAGYAYTFFHGGVPSKERGKLIAKFKEDPKCRIFLSTDAGSVGLNLQNASVVINMDQPWNPAVLEQRIGRVHRLGQKRPVRVVHFISQGTIEEGMLGILSFKKSMFAGVFDDGNNEVFLGESKLKRFIDSVEKVTGSIPESMPNENAESKQLKLELSDVNAEEKMPDNPWNDLISAGASILQNLSKVVAASDKNSNPFLVQDQNGTRYLKFPVPDKDQLRAITNVLLQFTQVAKNAKEDANIPESK